MLGELAVDFGRNDRLVRRRIMDGDHHLRPGGKGKRKEGKEKNLFHNYGIFSYKNKYL